MNGTLVDLPTPANISVNWNYGSLLGLTLIIQLVTGLILAFRFSAHSSLSFDSVILITQDASYGWFLRLLHSTGATMFFVWVYLHIARGIYYGSFVIQEVWNLGVVIYLILMGTAFLGYVLPWGQISYWGATVITNLLSSVPYVGTELVQVVWGSFSVDNPTLTRFFTLHYLLPFIIAVLAMLHLFFLHMSGSSNPLGVSSNVFKVPFHHYFSVKDLMVYFVVLFLFLIGTLHLGYSFIDAENFIPANPLVTPVHIQPEWYFLFAYAILRSIPNKLGGVIALLLAVLVLFAFSINSRNFLFSGFQFSPVMRFVFWSLVSNFALLTWLGACPASEPFTTVALPLSATYFILMSVLVVSPHISNRLYLSH